MLNNIVDSCKFLLKNYPDAQECRDYLNSRISQESQDLFEFGYFPEPQNISILTTLVDNNELIENKLSYIKNIEDSMGPRSISVSYFENYPIIIPFKDSYGNIVALVGRTLLSEDERKKQSLSKYKNTIFTKGNYLFGLNENKKNIIQSDFVYIVEGQFDVIKAYEKGLRNIVALGNSNMTQYQFSVITRYTNNIFLLLDNDDAGEKGRRLILNKFGRFANIRNLYVPSDYKDIDEYLSSENYTELRLDIKN